jgi:hypothetical protein
MGLRPAKRHENDILDLHFRPCGFFWPEHEKEVARSLGFFPVVILNTCAGEREKARMPAPARQDRPRSAQPTLHRGAL